MLYLYIDYIFTKGIAPVSLDVGSYEDWIKASDHMPLISSIKL